MKRFALLAICPVLFFAACSSQPPIDRAGRLLEMTAEEAGSITSTLERFARQLNIANTQIRTGRYADADKSLLLARDTLASTKDDSFDSFHQIAGWTAISQLAQWANDKDLALKSADKALAALNDVTPVPQRAQYVLSLATQIESLKGRIDATELLNSGGAWAGEITDPAARRQALVAITYRLITYDSYDDARKVLHRDADATWRTDTLLALANSFTQDAQINDYDSPRLASSTAGSGSTGNSGSRGGRGGSFSGGAGSGAGGAGGGAGGAASARPSASSSPPSYGKDVHFESVYQR